MMLEPKRYIIILSFIVSICSDLVSILSCYWSHYIFCFLYIDSLYLLSSEDVVLQILILKYFIIKRLKLFILLCSFPYFVYFNICSILIYMYICVFPYLMNVLRFFSHIKIEINIEINIEIKIIMRIVSNTFTKIKRGDKNYGWWI